VSMMEDQLDKAGDDDDETCNGDVSDSTYLEEMKCAWWKTSARLERAIKHMMVMLVTPRTWRRRSVHGGRLVWRGWRGQ
jgi:hypothetical protein